jgi:transposase
MAAKLLCGLRPETWRPQAASGRPARPNSDPAELRERAIRLVDEWLAAREAQGRRLKEVGAQLGVHPEAIRNWLRQHEIDGRSAEADHRRRASRSASGRTSSGGFFGADVEEPRLSEQDAYTHPFVQYSIRRRKAAGCGT